MNYVIFNRKDVFKLKPEKVLSMLSDSEQIEELRKLCEEEIRKSLALKTNSKSRVSNMSKILKENEKNNQERLLGYGFDETTNKYMFSNKIILFLLNDNLGYDENPNFPTPSVKPKTNYFKVNLEEVLYSIKTKENLRIPEDGTFEFDYKYMDIITKILGDCEIRFDLDTKAALEFVNKDDEHAILLGIKR